MKTFYQIFEEVSSISSVLIPWETELHYRYIGGYESRTQTPKKSLLATIVKQHTKQSFLIVELGILGTLQGNLWANRELDKTIPMPFCLALNYYCCRDRRKFSSVCDIEINIYVSTYKQKSSVQPLHKISYIFVTRRCAITSGCQNWLVSCFRLLNYSFCSRNISTSI